MLVNTAKSLAAMMRQAQSDPLFREQLIKRGIPFGSLAAALESPPAPQLVEKREPECACGHPYACGAAERAARQPAAQPSEAVEAALRYADEIAPEFKPMKCVVTADEIVLTLAAEVRRLRTMSSQPKPGLSSEEREALELCALRCSSKVIEWREIGAREKAELELKRIAILRKLAKGET